MIRVRKGNVPQKTNILDVSPPSDISSEDKAAEKGHPVPGTPAEN